MFNWNTLLGFRYSYYLSSMEKKKNKMKKPIEEKLLLILSIPIIIISAICLAIIYVISLTIRIGKAIYQIIKNKLTE